MPSENIVCVFSHFLIHCMGKTAANVFAKLLNCHYMFELKNGCKIPLIPDMHLTFLNLKSFIPHS